MNHRLPTLASSALATAALVALSCCASVASAGPMTELITNGEFDISYGGGWTGGFWAKVPEAQITGWDSTESHIEVWKEGRNGAPLLGTDGLATGYHAELTGDHQTSSLSTTILIPADVIPGSLGLLSFDLWNRKGSGVSVHIVDDTPLPEADDQQTEFGLALTCELADKESGGCSAPRQSSQDITHISSSGELLQPLNTISKDANGAWVRVKETVAINPGALFTLYFTGIDGGSSGAHIDQVSFLVERVPSQLRQASANVPAPPTLAILLAGLAFLRLRRGVRGK